MATKWWAIALVLLCTLLTTSAQILLKSGADKLPLLFLNWQLFLGIISYVIGAFILILAFKGGEVTVIYPIFASSYIWVSLLSVYFFLESFNTLKISGIFVVVFGITFIALGSRKGSAIEYVEAP